MVILINFVLNDIISVHIAREDAMLWHLVWCVKRIKYTTGCFVSFNFYVPTCKI